MANKSKKILSEISAGELLDKISILEIKIQKVTDKKNQEEIQKEYNVLKDTRDQCIDLTYNVKKQLDDIKKINVILWEIEDKIRICEKKNDFGKDFIELARGVYINNDKRAKIKSEINKILGSNIKEIKQYVDY